MRNHSCTSLKRPRFGWGKKRRLQRKSRLEIKTKLNCGPSPLSRKLLIVTKPRESALRFSDCTEICMAVPYRIRKENVTAEMQLPLVWPMRPVLPIYHFRCYIVLFDPVEGAGLQFTGPKNRLKNPLRICLRLNFDSMT